MFIELMIFFSTHMTSDNYAALFDIVNILHVLSHGQASVERGFSVNDLVNKTESLKTSFCPSKVFEFCLFEVVN